ncbi:MAG: hypothetical protein J6Q76_08955 [Clostridia bacterium]|nr:hypothetical protein [Clostridia bacterium]
MIIIRNIKMPLDTDFGDLKAVVSKKFNINARSVRLFKKAVDARRKDDVCFNCAFLVESENDAAVLKRLRKYDVAEYCEKTYIFPTVSGKFERPVVVGFGPCGMFAALSLAKAGLCPIVLERGRDVDRRMADVEAFFKTNELDEQSNIQFGEGGAGTFSDGKLNTGIKDPRIAVVLKTFADHGAGEKILYDAKPHIGTDVLVKVVKSIRQEIIALGGEVLFEHKLTNIKSVNNRVTSVTVEAPEVVKEIPCQNLLLCVGHSARDTFEMLKKNGVEMQPKAFAVGARIEHLQSVVNRSQYGEFAEHSALGAADYRLAEHISNGRGVFTFCMCPGGEVVNASSEKGRVAVNGMSYNARNGRNANSAVLVGIDTVDYYKDDVLDGMYFQRTIEEKAFEVGKGLPVSENLGTFLGNGSSNGSVIPTVKTGVTFGKIEDVLPRFVTDSLKEGILLFDRKLKGFADPSAVLTAPETRSSSPVKIIRDECGVASLKGLYPCGEGAGYAGGITSAAVDGLKTAEKVIEALKNA